MPEINKKSKKNIINMKDKHFKIKSKKIKKNEVIEINNNKVTMGETIVCIHTLKNL